MSARIEAELPVFAVVGRVNMGKSAVLATLLEIDDNQLIRVSPTPGETTCCQEHRLVFGERECVRFIDTPGFSRPIEAMRVIQQLHGEGPPGLDSLRRFVTSAGDDFQDEKRLLEPLLAGAGVLYVVDPTKPLRDDFLAEMEILRWTGRPRLALLNRRGETVCTGEEEWRSRLGGSFNLVRTFDAHRARYGERLRLLRGLLDIEEGHRGHLEETIRLVEDEWRCRREDAAERIMDFLTDALRLRVVESISERDKAVKSRRERKQQKLAQRYYRELAGLERHLFDHLLEIYRHHLLTAEASGEFAEIDLQCAETWRKWGLSRWQLAAVGAAAGGAAGLALDAATGGLTHGAGTVAGALGGGVGTWWMGGSLPDLKLSITAGIRLGDGTGRALEMGPPKTPNFPWVLLDGVLTRYQRMLARAHGRRDEETLAGGSEGFTRQFAAARRSLLGKWFAACLKQKNDARLEPQVVAELVTVLEEVEHGNTATPTS
ncbi:MAG: GTPase/DUF3482 domain-containing protein [Akkermansiaceae bacterium]|nr:GTPase/DUF3482 domain-containing protein [Akkermansiaceae bacterium]MCF7733155.1 GTPase/DUF3482 domain-containing protein [Akkermansiaceae bacterium]